MARRNDRHVIAAKALKAHSIGDGPIPDGWFTVNDGAQTLGVSVQRAHALLRNLSESGGTLERQWWRVNRRKCLIYRERQP